MLQLYTNPIPAIPALFILVILGWGILQKKKEKTIRAPKTPWLPYLQSPGLSMELADSVAFVDRLLGDPAVWPGDDNRKAITSLQYLDFVFIPLYTAFLIAVAVIRGGWSEARFVIALALATAVLDFLEDFHILRIVSPKPGGSVRPYGRLKWLFYFATLAAEGCLMLFQPLNSVRAAAGAAFGIFLILLGAGGVRSSLKINFIGIRSAANFSGLALLGLAIAPLAALSPAPWREVAEYVILLRVPLLVGALLFALPFIAFYSGARSLLQGLFDLTPLSVFTVTLTAFTVAGTACMTGHLVLAHGYQRFGNIYPVSWMPLHLWCWVLIMAALSAPVILYSVWFSAKRSSCAGTALAGTLVAFGLTYVAIVGGSSLGEKALPHLSGFERCLQNSSLFQGYVPSQTALPGAPNAASDPLADHVRALVGCLLALGLYGVVGFLGWWCLGRRHLGEHQTVPALSAALMLMIVLGWMLSATAFFLDAWHVPILLIIAAAGTFTTFSTRSDHYYDLWNRAPAPAPTPAQTLAATKAPCAIVVAANGGGIQAGAWAAQVLFGLCNAVPDNKFQSSLRLISSVSGGSLGNACFVHWLANPANARSPEIAAAESSLDEVAWGLAWTDLLRGLFPWYLGDLIGRGRALERAWRSNSSVNFNGIAQMDAPLSNWNQFVASGDLPAVVMNATITETGERLLLSTTELGNDPTRARREGASLHTYQDQNGNTLHGDVGVVTAARLSASFPYVTPAARSKQPGPQPHVVDGGYYDNYGMATLVEWLDSALQAPGNRLKKILVIEIHGAPVAPDPNELYKTDRGWFYQAIAPLITLNKVRGSGQIAHKQIEVEFLQQKWKAQGVAVDRVVFEFPRSDAPLSWHLTSSQKQKIRDAWEQDPDVAEARRHVQQFLAGCENSWPR